MTFLQRILTLLFTTAVLSVAACQYIAVSDTDRFEANRKLWRESGVKDYRMRVHIQKPGHATPMGKFIIEVRGGSQTTIRSESKPEDVIDTNTHLREFHRYDTIDDIFDFIEQSRRPDAAIQQIEYEPVLGYPKRLHMDPARTTIDDELFFEVLEFERL